VSKAVKAWNATVPDELQEIRDSVKVAKAVSGLDAALQSAANKLANAKLKKTPGYKPTVSLIALWQKEVSSYKAKLQDHIRDYPKRKKKADDLIEAVDEQLEDALTRHRHHDKLLANLKKQVDLASRMIRGGGDVAKARTLLEKNSKSFRRSYEQLEKFAGDLKGDKKVEEFRRLGGIKIVKEYALWKEDIPVYTRMFQATTRKFDEVQTLARKLDARVEKQSLLIDILLAESASYYADYGKALDVATKLEKAVKARKLKAEKLLKESSGRMLRLNAQDVAGDAKLIKAQRHVAKSQMSQVNEKIPALQKMLRTVDQMFSKSDSSLIRLKNVDRKEMDDLLEGSRKAKQELEEKVREWMRKHEAALKHVSQYLKDLDALEREIDG
jgi:hypothetical protein